MSVIPDAEVDAVMERAQGCCEACGEPITGRYALHHRKSRRFNDHRAVNLMLVHGDFDLNCHNLHQNSIHQNPERSYRLGHIVKSWQDPSAVSVLLFKDDEALPAFADFNEENEAWVRDVWPGGLAP